MLSLVVVVERCVMAVGDYCLLRAVVCFAGVVVSCRCYSASRVAVRSLLFGVCR